MDANKLSTLTTMASQMMNGVYGSDGSVEDSEWDYTIYPSSDDEMDATAATCGTESNVLETRVSPNVAVAGSRLLCLKK